MAESPSTSGGKKRSQERAESAEKEEGDGDLRDSPDSPRAKPPPKKAKDEFCSDDEAEAVKVAEKQKEELKKRKYLWANDEPYVNVEYPYPTGKDRTHFCWYDVSEEWDETKRPKPAPPLAFPDPTFKYGEPGFVKLPFAEYTRLAQRGTSSRPRFELIREALMSFAAGVRDFNHVEAGINSYFREFKATNLRKYCGEDAEMTRTILQMISNIAKIALRSQYLFTRALPQLLQKGTVKSVSMTQEQAACLLAYGFFCAFPKQLTYFNDSCNFLYFHTGAKAICMEKMKFILAYFKQVYDVMPTGILTYTRQEWDFRGDEARGYDRWNDTLSDLHVTHEGLIEELDGCLQVDFANEYIGGGVMHDGCVQEEIRFLCCPEMLVSLLLFDVMEANEAILIQGAQQYSGYTGYSKTTKHRPMQVRTGEPRDRFGRARSYLVAIDAICYVDPRKQYLQNYIAREIKKAYAGFMRVGGDDPPARPVATGNWGCGVFKGDKELKSLIQLIATSKAGRPMIYVTFNDKEFAKDLKETHQILVDNEFTNGQVFQIIANYKRNRTSANQGLFELINDLYA